MWFPVSDQHDVNFGCETAFDVSNFKPNFGCETAFDVSKIGKVDRIVLYFMVFVTITLLVDFSAPVP